MENKLELNVYKTVFGTEVRFYSRPDTTDKMTAEAIMIHDEYKATELLPYYQNGDVFIDCGSHIGSWALMMASLNPTFKVFAYEALPENCKLINKNIQVNCFDNVEAHNLAIAENSEGYAQIFYREQDTAFGKAHRFIGSSMGNGANSINIPKISLEDILDGIDRVKVLKIDTEGAECLAFPTLTKESLRKIDFIVGEFHGLGMDIDKFWKLFKDDFIDVGKPLTNKFFGDFFYKNKRLT